MTHVTVGAQTSDPLHRRRALYLKSYLDSLLLAIRNFYLGHQAGRHNTFLIYVHCTHSTLHQKCETSISRNETAWPRSQFLYSCLCARFIYSRDRLAYFAVFRLRTDRGNV